MPARSAESLLRRGISAAAPARRLTPMAPSSFFRGAGELAHQAPGFGQRGPASAAVAENLRKLSSLSRVLTCTRVALRLSKVGLSWPRWFRQPAGRRSLAVRVIDERAGVGEELLRLAQRLAPESPSSSISDWVMAMRGGPSPSSWGADPRPFPQGEDVGQAGDTR